MEQLVFRREFSTTQLFFSIIFIIIGSFALFLGIVGINHARDSVNWPSVRGKITASSVGVNYSSGRTGTTATYYPKISYTFIVNDTTFKGNRIIYGGYVANNQHHADRVIKKYPQGKSIQVYYMPDNPKECLLEPGLEEKTWVIPTFGSILIGLGILMAIFHPKKYKRIKIDKS